MTKEPMVECELYTLRVDGTAIAVCALPVPDLEKNQEGVIRDAFVETWIYGGGDPMRLAGRALEVRTPTKEEGEVWEKTANVAHKPYILFEHEPMGAA
jgi:hypothetical protein